MVEIERPIHSTDFDYDLHSLGNHTLSDAIPKVERAISIEKMRGERLELGIIIAVDWTGENVLSEDELVHRTVDAMLKLGIGPQRTDRFSAVEEIEEGWL